jgi:hypothetical protein
MTERSFEIPGNVGGCKVVIKTAELKAPVRVHVKLEHRDRP